MGTHVCAVTKATPEHQEARGEGCRGHRASQLLFQATEHKCCLWLKGTGDQSRWAETWGTDPPSFSSTGQSLALGSHPHLQLEAKPTGKKNICPTHIVGPKKGCILHAFFHQPGSQHENHVNGGVGPNDEWVTQ